MTPKEFAKKIIASINPGTADISGIGDGTIKGAISEQNKKLVYSILDVISFEHTVYIGQAPDANNFIIPYGVTYEKAPSSIIVELTSPHYVTPIIMDKTNNQCKLAILKSSGNAGDITITGNLILIK